MHISFVYFTEKRFENKKMIKQPKNQRNFCRVCFSFPLGQPRPRVFSFSLRSREVARGHREVALARISDRLAVAERNFHRGNRHSAFTARRTIRGRCPGRRIHHSLHSSLEFPCTFDHSYVQTNLDILHPREGCISYFAEQKSLYVEVFGLTHRLVFPAAQRTN